MYQELIQKYPQSNWAGCALVGMSRLLMSQQRYDEAIACCRKALREYPQAKFGNGKPAAAFAAYYIVEAFMSKRSMAEARIAYEEAVKQYPAAVTEDGRLLRELYDPKLGRRGPSVKGFTGPAGELSSRASRIQREQPEEALRVYQELVAKYPKDPLAPVALLHMASITARLNGFPEGTAILQRVIQEYPEARYSWGDLIAGEAAYRIGRFYYKSRDMQNAKKAFDFALEKYKDTKTSSGMLFSHVYADSIRATNTAIARGTQWVRKEMRIPPPGDPAERLYREAYFARDDEAVKFYDELIAKFPQHERTGEALVRSAWILVGKQRSAEAIQRLQQIVEKYPNAQWPNGTPIAPEASYVIGSLYHMQKDMQNAKKAFDYALQHYRDARSDEGVILSQRYEVQIKQVNSAVGK